MSRAWLLLGVMLLAGCDATPPSASSTSNTSAAASTPAPITDAHYDGYGNLRLGIDEQTFRQTWGGELRGTPTQDGGCYYLTPKWAKSAADFGFMFEHGRFVRYDVGTAKEAAPGGGKVGMDIAQIRALYGNRVEQQPHKYEQDASYLRIASQNQGVLLFETDATGKITRWRVGVPPQIDYVEGCS